MRKVRGHDSLQIYYGRGTQPERLAAVLRYTPPGARILDLGSGQGAYMEVLNRQGFLTVGVDINYYPQWDSSRGWFVQASATSLPFANQEFHTTICFEVLEHCPDPQTILAEIVRCTSSRLIMTVPNCDLNNALRRYDLALAHWTDVTHCNFFKKEDIRSLLHECGYRVIEMSDCYRVCPNDYFWDTLRLPKIITKVMKRLCRRLGLVETYWSSILIVAEVPGAMESGATR